MSPQPTDHVKGSFATGGDRGLAMPF